MRVISFDIGIKTLSFAVFDTTAADPLADWKIFNMCERQPATCCAPAGACGAAVKYTHGDRAYCKRHAKQVPGAIMPGTRHSPTQLSKMAVGEVLAVATELGCTPTTRTKKAAVAAIREYYDGHTLVNYVAPKAADVDMVTLAERIRTDLNSVLPSDLTGYTALIENQLGPQAVRMRCVQAMLTMHLLHRGCPDIQYVSPRRKLQDQPPEVDVRTYPARKKAARDAVPRALTEMNCDKRWHTFFAGHKKQDDLADAFLQARWYIRNQGQ
jgi:hypothetical protein